MNAAATIATAGATAPVGRRGSASARIARDGGRSYVARLRAESPLRLLTPRGGGDAAWLVASSFGGGLVDGDELTLDVTVAAGASCLVTTQSSTKIYRGVSAQTTRARVEGGATLLVLPDPAVPFAGADFRQTTEVALASTSSLALLDIVTAGRVARGERWAADRLATSLSVDVGGRPLLRDALLLDPAHGPLVGRLGRFDALATVVLLGPVFDASARVALQAIRSSRLSRGAEVVVAGSALGDGLFVRIGATTIASLLAAARELLGPACAAAGEDPWSRRW